MPDEKILRYWTSFECLIKRFSDDIGKPQKVRLEGSPTLVKFFSDRFRNFAVLDSV